MDKKKTAIALVFSATIPLLAGTALAQGGAEAEEPGFFGRLFGLGQRDEAKQRDEQGRDEAKRRDEDARDNAQKRADEERAQAEKQRDKKVRDHDQEGEGAADKGKKKGWVNGMPPGQAKGKDKADKARSGKERQVDEEHVDEEHAQAAESAPEGQQPQSTEEVMRGMAKDKAIRASGAAEGSAEAELVRMGTDAIIDRAK